MPQLKKLNKMIPVHFDLETSDPDDVLTICFLANHPKIDLKSISVTPGSKFQIGLIKHVLNLLDLKIPIGSFNPNHEKECVSTFHYKWFGKIGEDEPDGLGHEIIEETVKNFPDVILLTGGPLKNLGQYLLNHTNRIQKWVAQGGFAGDNVVPEHLRLEKFKGKITCPTFNFNGDPKSAKLALETNQIIMKYLISKNVCHGLVYDRQMHEKLSNIEKNVGLQLMYEGMECYLKDHPKGKIFHDPLAAITIVDRNICEYEEVEMFREKGEWGANKKEGTNTFISIDVDKNKFFNVFIGND